MSGVKNKLLDWVDDRREIDPLSKAVLDKLARFADAQCCAWAQIATLAYATNLSERTVQYRLRTLEAAGLIRQTDRVWRLQGSTRSVPIYQLAPDEPGLGLAESMGAQRAPIEPHGCTDEGGMGAAACTPKGTKGTKDANASTAGAREGGPVREVMARLRAAYPRRALGWTDPAAAMAALEALVEAGVDIAVLPACAERMAADPAIKRRDFGPPRMEAWLAKRQFEGWLEPETGEGAAATTGPTRTAFADAALRAAVVRAKGEAFAVSYLDRAAWDGDGRVLTPRTRTAFDHLAALTGVLAGQSVTLANPASPSPGAPS